MSGMKLYELQAMFNEAAAIAEQQAIDNDGVIDDDWADFLDDLEMARDEKAINVGRYIKNLSAEAAAIKAEKEKLASRQKVAENKVSHLKAYLLTFLADGEKIADETVAIATRNNAPSVFLVDDFECPEEYQRIKVEPDKTAIKGALKDGLEIPGALLIKTRSVTIK